MNNTDSISLIVGALLPPVIAVITREHWSSQVKGLIALVVCLVGAVGVAWWTQTADWHNLRATIPLVVVSAFGMYHAFYRPSGITDTIESGVNAGTPPQPAPLPPATPPSAPAAKA